jgi:hypothetical protein
MKKVEIPLKRVLFPSYCDVDINDVEALVSVDLQNNSGIWEKASKESHPSAYAYIYRNVRQFPFYESHREDHGYTCQLSTTNLAAKQCLDKYNGCANGRSGVQVLGSEELVDVCIYGPEDLFQDEPSSIEKER